MDIVEQVSAGRRINYNNAFFLLNSAADEFDFEYKVNNYPNLIVHSENLSKCDFDFRKWMKFYTDKEFKKKKGGTEIDFLKIER